MEKCSIPKATFGRLPRYLRYLRSLSDRNNEYISATAIAKNLSLGEVQVRKDLNAVSGAGRPKVGYEIKNLIKSIEKALGYDNLSKAVIVGAGKLGQALLNFTGFDEYGVEILAAFDIAVKEQSQNQCDIYPMKQFENFCKSNRIQIGVITTCESAAQEVCDQMVKSDIKAIWNFTPQKLVAPENILIKQENLALSMAYLNNQLLNHN